MGPRLNMPIHPDLLLAHKFPAVTQRYARRDAILYALGVGLGAEDAADLPFLLEDRLVVLPTFGVTLAALGMWIKAPEFGVDFAKLVHYEQAAQFHASLPPEGEVVGQARIASVRDRGEGKGALVVVEREISDAHSKTLYCTLRQTLLLRADGGFGGAPVAHQPTLIPDRAPDIVARFATDRRAALIYRLSGDLNPLHSDPEAAKRAGFARPILHGLASYGAAGVAVSRALGRSPAEVKQLDCRFSGVVFPGDELCFRIWRTEGGAVFQAYVGERKALDQGRIAL
ncbi:MAG: MaoC family dehydratase N-terminal domain-containing protein [Pseudomonadota bacterium]|nr:MaoC family dehydratase N-terminal domain-containing protein [Pseudomonadota bacterium]